MSRISLVLSATCLVLAGALQAQTAGPVVNGGFPLVSPSAPRIWTINADGSDLRQLTGRH
jgi:hypothetical protein